MHSFTTVFLVLFCMCWLFWGKLCFPGFYYIIYITWQRRLIQSGSCQSLLNVFTCQFFFLLRFCFARNELSFVRFLYYDPNHNQKTNRMFVCLSLTLYLCACVSLTRCRHTNISCDLFFNFWQNATNTTGRWNKRMCVQSTCSSNWLKVCLLCFISLARVLLPFVLFFG